jgi:hypothetical protein
VPTKNDILVPETLLKRRKSQEKAREARAADLKKKRDVSDNSILSLAKMERGAACGDENNPTNHCRLGSGQCCRYVNHLSGLNSQSLCPVVGQLQAI